MAKSKIVKNTTKQLKNKEIKVVEQLEEDRELYATRDELYALLYGDARVKNAVLAKRVHERELLNEQREYQLAVFSKILDDPELLAKRAKMLLAEKNLENIREQLDAEREEATAEMEDEKKRVEERLGINFVDYSFFPETGLFKKPSD
jgi:hypothetical protein